jgi:NADH:ubiquinone oxidoreductase subunit K
MAVAIHDSGYTWQWLHMAVAVMTVAVATVAVAVAIVAVALYR